VYYEYAPMGVLTQGVPLYITDLRLASSRIAILFLSKTFFKLKKQLAFFVSKVE